VRPQYAGVALGPRPIFNHFDRHERCETHSMRIALSLAAVVVSITVPKLVLACSVFLDPAIAAMPNGGTAPRNAVLVALHSAGIPSDINLETAAGEPVDLTVTCEGTTHLSGVQSVCIGTPSMLLEPGEYHWVADVRGGTEATFQVVEQLDDEPPTATGWSMTASYESESDPCGGGDDDIVAFDFDIDDMPDNSVFIASSANSDGDVYGASVHSSFRTSTFETRLGDNVDGGCVDARLVDSAGNVTQLDQVCYETSGCSCRIAGNPRRSDAGHWLAGLALGLMMLRRRRRRYNA